MFKNIFNTPESLRGAILGQDDIRARSQQGLQAVRSGVESLRTVLANNPAPSETGGSGSGLSRDSTGIEDSGRLNEAKTGANSAVTRGRSGSWSLLPPSLSGRSHAFNSSSSSSSSSVSAQTERNRTGYRPGGGEMDGTSETTSRPNSLTGSSSITESVAESIKSLSTGLGLAQLTGGLGLTGISGLHPHHGSGSGYGPGSSSGSNPSSHPRRGTMDTSQASQSSMVTTASGSQTRKHPMLLSNRGRVWTWNGQEGVDAEDFVGSGPPGLGLKTGAQTEEAARETEARLTRLREQEDASLARSRRMPEVELMAQRYQDSWKEIHEHTARNAEKADNADEILGKVLELCQRHVEVSSLMETECKGLKELGKSLDDMVVVSGNIHKKLMGLEAMIEKLEEGHEEMSLADWKKSKVMELDKYMESKRNELWDKAEVLSTRSGQFQKEETARKLKLYQSQFESDMAHFRRTQKEKEQELLWKAAQQDPTIQEQLRDMSTIPKESEDLNTASDDPTVTSSSSSATKSRDEFLFGARIPSSAAVFATASKLLSSLESARRGQGANFEGSNYLEASSAPRSRMPRTREPSTSLLALEDTEDWRDKEDLDNFLGPATEENEVNSDLKLVPKLVQSDYEEEGEDKKETIILQDVEYEDEASELMLGNCSAEEENDAEEETTEEESSEDEEDEEEEDLDPIAKARQARAAAAAAAAAAGHKTSTGSTISAFSALAKHSSTS